MLIEREQPLKELTDLFAETEQGRGGVALVGGEAGIGKSALLEAFRVRVGARARVLWGMCDALFTPRPLGPVHDMAGLLGRNVQKILAQGAAPGHLFSEILNQLEQSDQASVLVIEDVHWADHASLDFLKFLCRRVAFLPVMLVISYRKDEIDAKHPFNQVLGDLEQSYVHRITLQPLSIDGVRLLGNGDTENITELHRITGGNPFFVTELLSAPKESRSTIPASVKEAVAARLNRLGAVESKFLETISLIPGSVEVELLAPLFGEQGETLAMACVGRGLLMQNLGGPLRFRHELARLATLSRLTAIEQQATHNKIVIAMERLIEERPATMAWLDRLVHHAAGALDADRVLLLAPQAARQAIAVGAHREAAAHLSTALKFVDKAEPEVAAQLYQDWAYEAGISLRIDDEVLEARRHAISLWRALKRPEKIGENLRWLSRLHWYRGEAALANRFADEAVQVLDTTRPSVEQAMAYSLRSQLHMLNNRLVEAIDWGQRALVLARKFDDAEVIIHALNNIGTAELFSGNADGRAPMQESLELAIEYGMHEHAARVYTNLSEYAVVFRDFDLAEHVTTEGLAFDSQHDLDAWTHYLVGRLAQLRMDQGRLRDAETIARGVLKLERLTLLMRLPALIVLAKTQMRRGGSDADELLAQALLDAKAIDEPQYIIPVRLALIESSWLNSAPESAREHFEYLDNLSAESMHAWYRGELISWARRLSYPLINTDQSNIAEPFALELAGELDNASNAWQAIGSPYSQAIVLLNTESKSKPEHLVKALRILDRLGAESASSLGRTLAQQQGLSKKMPRAQRGPYNAARDHPLGLTRREQDILQLMAKSLSNAEIAAKLSRSQRTVEHHVSSVLGKLNAANRIEAILRVSNEPWLLPKSAP